jgi:4-hydroxy-tetrahydrodipicolinate synthase
MASISLEKPSSWTGIWTALITPLSQGASGLEIDQPSLKKLIDQQIASGLRGFVIAGSTGEGSLLGAKLYEKLLRSAFEIVAGRVPLVAGLGIGGTAACLENLRLAKSIGYSGALGVVPAYIKAPQRGLVDHYLSLGAECLPICVYEVGSRSASSVEVATLKEICASAHPGAKWIVAIKDASGNLDRAKATREVLPASRLALLSGDDGTFSGFLRLGGNGLISVVSHFTPKSLVRMMAAPSQTEQERLLPLIDAIFCESNPIPTKSMLKAIGTIASDAFCPPLVPMRPDLLENSLKVLRETQD